jgi:polygalacturonase
VQVKEDEMAVDPLNVRVTDFGAIGDNSHDDGPAIREAHNYCSTAKAGYYLPLHFPVGRYRVDSAGAIPFKNGMHWTGEGHANDEKEYRSQIRYSKSHFFSLGGTREFAVFTGLCFDGRSQPYSLVADGQLNYTTFDKCGFKNFNHVFNVPTLGCKILNSFFQNNLCTGTFSGSDNIIENNYISGSNYNPGSGNSISADGKTFAVKFGSFTLNRFNKNFITGRPQMALGITSDITGTIIDGNWFDICDMSGVHAKNSSGGVFVNNTFNRCMIGQDSNAKESFGTTDPKYDSIVRLEACTDMGFWNNAFMFFHGLPAGNPVKTFHTTGCDGIAIANNLFKRPYKRLDTDD